MFWSFVCQEPEPLFKACVDKLVEELHIQKLSEPHLIEKNWRPDNKLSKWNMRFVLLKSFSRWWWQLESPSFQLVNFLQFWLTFLSGSNSRWMWRGWRGRVGLIYFTFVLFPLAFNTFSTSGREILHQCKLISISCHTDPGIKTIKDFNFP